MDAPDHDDLTETALVFDLGPQPPGSAGYLLDLMLAVSGSGPHIPEVRRAFIVGGYRARAVLIATGATVEPETDGPPKGPPTP